MGGLRLGQRTSEIAEWFSCTAHLVTPPAHPHRVILPAAAVAALRLGGAKRSARQGGLRVGVGGRCNQTNPGSQSPNHPHPTGGSASPLGEARRQRRRQAQAMRRARQGGLRGGGGRAV
jgi:hypothetical protein